MGEIYEFYYNEDGLFSHSRIVILHEITRQDDIDIFRNIHILKAPTIIKDINYDKSKIICDYIE